LNNAFVEATPRFFRRALPFFIIKMSSFHYLIEKNLVKEAKKSPA